MTGFRMCNDPLLRSKAMVNQGSGRSRSLPRRLETERFQEKGWHERYDRRLSRTVVCPDKVGLAKAARVRTMRHRRTKEAANR